MKKGKDLLAALSSAAALMYLVIWFWFLTLVFGNPLYSLTLVLTSIIAAIALGGHVLRKLSKHINTSYLYTSLQIATASYGVVAIFILRDTTQFYRNFYFAYGVVWFIVTIHSILSTISIQAINISSSYEKTLSWAAAGSLVSGFILIPILGIYSIIFPALLNMVGSFFSRTRDMKKLKVDEGFYSIDFLKGIIFSLIVVFWGLYASRVVDPTKVFSILAYSMLLGIILGRSLRARSWFRPYGGNMLYAVIATGVSVFFFVKIPEGHSMILLLMVLFTLPIWTILADSIEHSIVSFAAGAVLGFLLTIFIIPIMGVSLTLTVATLLAIGLSIEHLRGEILELQRILPIAAALVITVFVLTIPIQAAPSEVTLLTQSFSRHIPLVLHQDEADIHSGNVFFTGGKYNVLVIEGDERKSVFYYLVRERLGGEGLLVQVIPLSEMQDANFKSVVRNTMGAFPHTSMWLVDKNALLISSSRPLGLDYIQMRERILGSDEISGDMKELFQATEFTDITIVDSFSLLYFMSEAELFDYTHDGEMGENAFLSVFDFKKEKSNTSLAFTRPPIVNVITREGEEVTIEFLKLRARLGLRWKGDARIQGVYGLVGNTTDYGISFDKGAVFINGTTTVRFQAFQSRITTSLDITDAVLILVDEEVRQKGLDSFIDRGYELQEVASEDADGYSKYILFGGIEGHDAKAISMVWFCESNNAINVVTVDYIHEDPELESILESVICG